MFETILIIFSFYALTHAIKESILFHKPRIYLIGKSPFFYHLFECYACVGFWAGLAVYLIANPIAAFDIRALLIWGLASSGISFVMNAVVEKLFHD